jgi:hypothetical protein
MKRFLKPLLLLTLLAVIISCKKSNTLPNGGGTVTAVDYTFNKAIKTFGPDTNVTASFTAPAGMQSVYCYLVRSNTPDSLIYISNTPDRPTTYTLSIPVKSFPINSMSAVTGVKLLAKQGDNSTVQGAVKIIYFDPAKPVFSGFAASITANLSGGSTVIAGNINSAFGIKQVDVYDDDKVQNTFDLVTSITNTNNVKQYALNYNYTYRKAAQHIKLVTTDIYGQTAELIINMPVDISAFKPIFVNFAASITPALTGTTSVTGTVTSITGLQKIDIYDDYQGTYVLITSVTSLNSALTYTLNYNYTFRRRAANIRLVAFDTDGLQTEKIIPLNITYQSNIFRNVVMNAQTTGTNTIFFNTDGSTLGNCDLNASESTMSFLWYGTSTGPSFYSPTNTSGVASNFKCSGVSWVIANPANLRATRFRVLVPGTTGTDNIYAQYNAGTIDLLDDAFFSANSVAVPSGSTAKFDPVAAPSTSSFNLTAAYLIWVRVPDANGTTFKNGLIHVTDATSTTGTSTVKFDIIVQK